MTPPVELWRLIRAPGAGVRPGVVVPRHPLPLLTARGVYYERGPAYDHPQDDAGPVTP